MSTMPNEIYFAIDWLSIIGILVLIPILPKIDGSYFDMFSIFVQCITFIFIFNFITLSDSVSHYVRLIKF